MGDGRYLLPPLCAGADSCPAPRERHGLLIAGKTAARTPHCGEDCAWPACSHAMAAAPPARDSPPRFSASSTTSSRKLRPGGAKSGNAARTSARRSRETRPPLNAPAGEQPCDGILAQRRVCAGAEELHEGPRPRPQQAVQEAGVGNAEGRGHRRKAAAVPNSVKRRSVVICSQGAPSQGGSLRVSVVARVQRQEVGVHQRKPRERLEAIGSKTSVSL